MIISDLLKKEKAYDYNLMDEKYNVEDPILKTLTYKYTKDGFDCDGSGEGNENSNICFLMREIYRELWGWQDKYKNRKGKFCYNRYAKCNNFNELLFGPETMTSFLTTFKSVIGNVEIFKNRYNIKLYSESIKANKDDDEIEVKLEDERANELYNKKNYIILYDEILRYCKCVGKIGNMTLTIAGFNTYKNYDYWDLKIDTQYLSNKALTEYAKNLYINTFFLWDYVNYDENKSQYCMKPFYDGHEDNPLPETKDDIEVLINKVCDYIDRRGKFIISLLRLKFENENKYNELWNVIINDQIHSMDEALRLIS